MTVLELTEDQKNQLKQFLMILDTDGNCSYEDLIKAETTISDEDLFSRFSGYTFTNDDFFNS